MSLIPELINNLVVDIPAAPTPAITTFRFLIFLLTTFVEFNNPARTTTAVPC